MKLLALLTFVAACAGGCGIGLFLVPPIKIGLALLSFLWAVINVFITAHLLELITKNKQ